LGKGRENESIGKGFNPIFAGICILMRRERRAPGLGKHARMTSLVRFDIFIAPLRGGENGV
jgi:hypothetical protein